MSWVKRLAAGVVAALRCAQQEDPEVAAGFERRVEALIAREIPLIVPAVAGCHASWDRPSEQTVRLVPPAPAVAVTALQRGTLDASSLRVAGSRR